MIGVATRGAAEAAGLLERDAELAEIERLVARACAGAGALLAVEGPAGVGKTRLLEAAALAGGRQAMLVLEATGSELEQELGFGVVRSLLERVLVKAGTTRRRSLLAGSAGLAEQVLLPSAAAERSSVPAEPAAVLHGLYWLVANLAERDPLLLIVDDAHWADRPSLQFLAYLARRLSGLSLLLVAAMRPNEPSHHGDLVSALNEDPAREVLVPAPLSEAAVGRLVAERFAPPTDREFVTACHGVTGGNPFLVGELIAALAVDRVAATAENAQRVGQMGPQTVSRAVLARVSRIGGPAAALTEAVAVLGGRGELRHVATLAGTLSRGA